jgi:GntR family transcriptional regulator/MocR family aminotransferase
MALMESNFSSLKEANQMELHIAMDGRKDLAGQLYRHLRAAILSDRLGPGERMPPSRLLASQLKVGRKTVSEAYTRLAFDGLVTSTVGRGTFVAGLGPAGDASPALTVPLGAQRVRRWNDLPTPLRHAIPEGVSRYEFIGGYASKTPFPHDEWRRCVLAALREETTSRGRYADTEGLPALRQAVAQFAGFTRGVRCRYDDVLITNGAQQALDLLARVLISPGDVVAVEEPGYPPARLLFESQGARVTLVPVDAEGICVDAIPGDARIVYVTPSHQFPLGMPMSKSRRRALLERAHAQGAIIVEDDYDSAFRYVGEALDSLQAMDRTGCVAYVGTFSKVLMPEIRVGYLIAPASLLRAVTTARHLTDWHNTTLVQRALARFIEGGNLARYIRRCHAVYSARRQRLLQRLGGDLSRWLDPIPTAVGSHLSAWLQPGIDVDLLCRLARRVDLGVYSIEPFHAGPVKRHGLFFGFGAIDSIDIDAALDLLHRVLVELDG